MSVFPRLLFPDAASVDRVQATAGLPLLSSGNATVRVYVNEAGTDLADILNGDESPNPTATLTLDNLSRIPEFYGPTSGTEKLWVRVDGGEPLAVYAQITSRLAALEASVAQQISTFEALINASFVTKAEFATNPLDFGAVGDGLADDTAAVQAAILAAVGGTCLIPGQTFRCESYLELPSNVTLLGLGPASELKFTWSAGGTYIHNTDPVAGNSNIRVQDLTISGAGDGTPFGSASEPASGLLFRRGSDLDVRGVTFRRVPGVSLAYQGVQRCRFIGNSVHEGGRDGITGWWNGQALSDIVVANNTIHTIGDDGIAVNASVGTASPNTVEPPRRISIVGNTIYGRADAPADNAGRGILVIGCEDVTISGNTISDTFSNGILLIKDEVAGSAGFRCKNVAVSGNVIRGAGASGDGSQPRSGIYVYGVDHLNIEGNTISESREHGIMLLDATFFTITGNNVHDNGTSCTAVLAHYGINLESLSDGTRAVRHGVVSGNMSRRNAANGIRCRWTDLVQLVGNTVLDNGDAGDGTLNYGAGIWLDGTGTFIAHGNLTSDTRGVGSKKQTHGILHTGAGGATVLLTGNYGIGNASGIGILQGATAPARFVKKGNLESPIEGQNFDVDASGVYHYSKAGTPEGILPAPPGSECLVSDGGGSGHFFWVKESGTGNTGWVAH